MHPMFRTSSLAAFGRLSCTPVAVANLLVRHMVFVGNVQKSPIASHLKGSDPFLDFCCQGPALTGIMEGG